ncbi:MAG TPA: radical SAM protein, partial [Armatimonadota bacterium]|nr:radical SAM protein [Armatimonadota bacterium]
MPALDRATALADETHIGGRPADTGRLRVGLLFPSPYQVGMANLALHTLYRLLNDHPEVICERVFYPPLDGDAGPLTSLETGTVLGGFDVVAVSSSWELDWPRIPGALRAGGIEPLARDRSDRSPLVIAGGPAVTANPEPLAEIADALFIGEVEEALGSIAAALLQGGSAGRGAALDALAQVAGMYVPARYRAGRIGRVAVSDLDAWPTHSAIVTEHCEFPGAFLIEVGRGCPRQCTFCLARQIYAPLRPRGLEGLMQTARLGLDVTDRIGLVGAAVADHPAIVELVTRITEAGGSVSTSSLRIERVTPELLAPLAQGGQRSITLAPEAADPEVAATLGKRIDPSALHSALQAAEQVGIRQVKLYFMVGAPGETDEQALRIADWVADLERDFPRIRLTVSVSPLVPRPHTELARMTVAEPDVLRRRLAALGRELRRRTHAQVRMGSARWGAVQTVLGRGGRELTPLLLEANGLGAGGVLTRMRALG